MARTHIRLGNIVLASILSGPVFLISLYVAESLTETQAAVALNELPAMMGLLMISVPFGFILSIVPNLLGSVVMVWIGDHNIAMRLPMMWAMVGAALAATPVTLSNGPASVVFGLTGACCALICRRKIAWVD